MTENMKVFDISSYEEGLFLLQQGFIQADQSLTRKLSKAVYFPLRLLMDFKCKNRQKQSDLRDD